MNVHQCLKFENYWSECLDLENMKYCKKCRTLLIRNFAMCTLHLILLGQLIHIALTGNEDMHTVFWLEMPNRSDRFRKSNGTSQNNNGIQVVSSSRQWYFRLWPFGCDTAFSHKWILFFFGGTYSVHLQGLSWRLIHVPSIFWYDPKKIERRHNQTTIVWTLKYILKGTVMELVRIGDEHSWL